jgi:hypothetical protein
LAAALLTVIASGAGGRVAVGVGEGIGVAVHGVGWHGAPSVGVGVIVGVLLGVGVFVAVFVGVAVGAPGVGVGLGVQTRGRHGNPSTVIGAVAETSGAIRSTGYPDAPSNRVVVSVRVMFPEPAVPQMIFGAA